MVNKVLLVGPRLKNNPGEKGVCWGFESLIEDMQDARVKNKVKNAYKNISSQSREAVTRQYIEIYEEIIRSR